MLNDEYMKVVIYEFLKRNKEPTYLNVNKFVEATGIEKKVIVKFLIENNYKEATIGTFIVR